MSDPAPSIKDIREAVAEAVAPLAEEVRALKAQVTGERRVYTIVDLWRAYGGETVCKLESFRHRKDLPRPDTKNGHYNGYTTETVARWLAGKKRKKG